MASSFSDDGVRAALPAGVDGDLPQICRQAIFSMVTNGAMPIERMRAGSWLRAEPWGNVRVREKRPPSGEFSLVGVGSFSASLDGASVRVRKKDGEVDREWSEFPLLRRIKGDWVEVKTPVQRLEVRRERLFGVCRVLVVRQAGSSASRVYPSLHGHGVPLYPFSMMPLYVATLPMHRRLEWLYDPRRVIAMERSKSTSDAFIVDAMIIGLAILATCLQHKLQECSGGS